MHQTNATPSLGAIGQAPGRLDQEPVLLRVLGWDHPRCMRPLHAAAARYHQLQPHVELSIRSRPLASFNDEPVEVAGRDVDLIVLDHPMVPQAAASGALIALDGIAESTRVRLELSEAISASSNSYTSGGHVWGIAVDAACQVAAARLDLLERLGNGVPATWDEVLALAADHPGRVALPLYPSDAFCALLSISAALAPLSADAGVDDWLSPGSVELLTELVACVDPGCFKLNPPALLEILQDGERWAYVPLTFGYASTSGPELTWADAPRIDGHPPGAVLGGAGLGITRGASSPTEALRFALWYARPETQGGIVLQAGGQPAARAVWDDPSADQQAHGLFSATRETIDHAVVRPRTIWWPQFQADASQRLHQLLCNGAPAARIQKELDHAHDYHANRRRDP